jgi:mono/diheme cytochrome c family protein
LQVTGESIPLEAEALLRVTPTGIDAGVHEVPLNRVFGNAWETHGTELSIAGDWSVEVVVLGAGADPWTATTPLTLNPPVLVDDGSGAPLFSPGGIVGLTMLAIGFAGFAFAWWVGRGPLRKEGAAIGGVAIALGLLLLMQARTTAGGVPLTASNPIPPTDASIARGEETFLASCAECHGVSGRGDGPLAASFVPPAADFTAGHTLAHLDGEFFNWIKGGKPPTAMPAFGDQLTDEQIWDVVNYLRDIQRDVRLEMPATPVATDPGP